MTALKVTALALGLVLCSTGAWAQFMTVPYCASEPDNYGHSCIPKCQESAIDSMRACEPCPVGMVIHALDKMQLCSPPQDPPVASAPTIMVPRCDAANPCGSGGSLSPDQKLARAFALCARYLPAYVVGESCSAIAREWHATVEKNEDKRFLQAMDDRAFIEEVARSLK